METLPIESRTYEPTEYWKSDIPEGQSGEWCVERFQLNELDPASLPVADHGLADYHRHRPGTYTRLRIGSVDMMTDLYEEWWSQRVPIQEALNRGGHVLISGLGLGMIVECLLRPEDSPVEQITVLEHSSEVIELVAAHLLARYGDRLRIIHTDARTWMPEAGSHFSVVWHDIWPDPDADYSGDIQTLHKRYANCCDWQQSWTRFSFDDEDTNAQLEERRVSPGVAYRFRPMTEADLPYMYKVFASTRQAEIEHTGWPPEQVEAFLQQQFYAQHTYYQEHFVAADFDVILSESGEGMGRLYLEERDDEFRVIDIALLPDFQRLGIGGQIMQGIIDRAFAVDKPVRIHVEVNNPAMRLYERLGFKMVEEQGVYHLMEALPPGATDGVEAELV